MRTVGRWRAVSRLDSSRYIYILRLLNRRRRIDQKEDGRLKDNKSRPYYNFGHTFTWLQYYYVTHYNRATSIAFKARGNYVYNYCLAIIHLSCQYVFKYDSFITHYPPLNRTKIFPYSKILLYIGDSPSTLVFLFCIMSFNNTFIKILISGIFKNI